MSPSAPRHRGAGDQLRRASRGGARAAQTAAEAANAARVLQDTPANDMTPTALAGRASELAAELADLTVTVAGRAEIVARGMGAFAAVAQGSYQEPALITLRYEGPGARGPTLGFVGKAVTFDSGGISLKPGDHMEEMKYDMSGGASVIEAIGAIARLRLPVRVLGVVGATENLPSGRSVKPGDIVRTLGGVSVEVNNTDAEGRLVLSDCVAYAIAEGAERLLDLATLTGACMVALGHTYAGLFSNDDAWWRRDPGGRRAHRRAGLAAAAARRVPQADQGRVRRHQQRTGRAARGRQHRCGVHPPLRGRDAMGPPGHRRHRLEPRTRIRGEGRLGLRRAAARRARRLRLRRRLRRAATRTGSGAAARCPHRR